ncbi:MAG TPA: glycoside hydrolase family 3 C-terminal domain-containing protein, partial [Methanocella sp.]|nr:glycoside hydrolase family 3 C-terminal domain-containing protein [Methanocella sp.]
MAERSEGDKPDVQSVLAQMTIEEKASLCTGASAWRTAPIDRLKVPSMTVADGPHGVRRCTDLDSLVCPSFQATCFPTASCLAASWDRDLLYALGQAMADEAIAQQVDVLLGPGVNMKRSPLGGRNFEYFSEDPYLAGEMAIALINGIQSKGVGTSLKHFAANNQEFKRFTTSAEIDERTLREIYLPAFEMAVKKAKPWTVMCAYNRLNGIDCVEHRELLTDILRYEWGFDGPIISDWGAVQSRVKALQAGLDLEMPGPRPGHAHAVADAVRTGALDAAVLDQSAARILSTISKAAGTPKGGEFDVDGHHALAGRIAGEGMVLLKNDGILPLRDPGQVAVIGLSAREPYFQGGGASHINPTQVSIPLDELKQGMPRTTFTYAEGYSYDIAFQQTLIDEAVEKAIAADVVILFIALPPFEESEGYDRRDMDLSLQQVTLIKSVSVAQPNTVVVLNNGAPVAVDEWVRDVPAVLEAWMMGQAGGKAIADVLAGRVNPSGKLAETFPVKLSDTPAYLNWPGENNVVRYGEGMFIGYRYYDAKAVPVSFPFGHGLSYTTFSYGNPQTTATRFKDTDGVTVSVDVTNSGEVAGKEIVQVYVHDKKSALVRPFKELKGFAKVDLRPGETKVVSVSLDFRAFAYYHPAHKRWITEDGDFDILIGASSEDIRYRIAVNLQSSLHLHKILDHNSTLREWLADSRGKVVIEPVFKIVTEQLS